MTGRWIWPPRGPQTARAMEAAAGPGFCSLCNIHTQTHTHCFKLWYETILNSKRNPGKTLWSLKSDFWIEESFYTWPSDSSKLHFPENTNKITSEQTTDVSACSSLSLTGQQSDTTLQRKVIQQMSPYTSVTAVINITWHQQTQIHLF